MADDTKTTIRARSATIKKFTMEGKVIKFSGEVLADDVTTMFADVVSLTAKGTKADVTFEITQSQGEGAWTIPPSDDGKPPPEPPDEAKDDDGRPPGAPDDPHWNKG